MQFPEARLIVMSKAPLPGQVKTRLVPLLGPAGAAELYCTLLEATLDKVCAADMCTVELCCAPDARLPYFTDCARRYPLVLTDQTPGDLGQRMSQAMAVALQQAPYAVLIGADCPALTPEDIECALQQLADGIDVILGPAADGGYYLVGLRRHYARLFQSIDWGSAQVLDKTLQQVKTLGLSHSLLPVHPDLDTPADYHAWILANPRRQSR